MTSKKRLISLFLTAIMLFAVAPLASVSVGAKEGDNAAAIIQQIKDTYTGALKLAGITTFNGWCGAYVGRQLQYLGINTSCIGGNGKNHFDKYVGMTTTSGGYYVHTYPASDYTVTSAINAITDNGTKNAYDILFGFEWSAYGDGQTYGHVMFVHAILDGLVYYSESSDWNGLNPPLKEGEPAICDITEFARRYRNEKFHLDGVVHFTKNDTPYPQTDYTSIAQDTYRIKNKSTGTYLTVKDNNDKGSQPVILSSYSGLTGQQFAAKSDSAGYTLRPLCSSERFVNPYYSEENNMPDNCSITITKLEWSNDRHWKFQAVSGGYVIHNCRRPELVISVINGVPSTEVYSEGKTAQIWTLETVSGSQTNGLTQEEAIAWVLAQEGKLLDYDNANDAQCVDLIKYYYAQFGYASYAHGNGSDYATNALPNGWQRIAYTSGFVAQPGDIAVWTYSAGSSSGHVAIVLSATSNNMTVMEQNHDNSGNDPCEKTTYKYGSSSMTFYGVIRPKFASSTPQTYTVSYNARGGSGAPTSQTKTHGVPLTLSTQTPAREGYTFGGWSVSANVTDKIYQPGESYTEDKDITLYAMWCSEYHGNKVSFDFNGGNVGVDVFKQDITVINGARQSGYTVLFTYSNSLVTTNYWGREFAVDSDGKVVGKRAYNSEEKLKVPEGGFVVSMHGTSGAYDLWEYVDIGDYCCYDKAAMKVYASKSPQVLYAYAKYVQSGGSVGTLPSAKRDGYTFDGWYTSANGGTKISSNTAINGAVTYYAHWTQTAPAPDTPDIGAPNADAKFDIELSTAPGEAAGEIKVVAAVKNITAFDISLIEFELHYSEGLTLVYGEDKDIGGDGEFLLDNYAIHPGKASSWESLSRLNDGYIRVKYLTTNGTAAAKNDGDLVFTFIFRKNDNANNVEYAWIPSSAVEGFSSDIDDPNAFKGNGSLVEIKTFRLGDINGDDEIDAADYILVKRHIIGNKPLGDDKVKRADINGDGEVDAADYILIKRHIIGNKLIPGAKA